jgi:hypothetical protein
VNVPMHIDSHFAKYDRVRERLDGSRQTSERRNQLVAAGASCCSVPAHLFLEFWRGAASTARNAMGVFVASNGEAVAGRRALLAHHDGRAFCLAEATTGGSRGLAHNETKIQQDVSRR